MTWIVIRLANGTKLIEGSNVLILLCLLLHNSWSHHLSPKLHRRLTRDISMRSSQHKPSRLRHRDKVALNTHTLGTHTEFSTVKYD